MNKLQILSLVGLLLAVSAHAEGFVGGDTYQIQCQQDPQLLGVGTQLTIGFGDNGDSLIATLVRTATTMPPQVSTQSFEVTSHYSKDGSTAIYSGKDFKLTVSEDYVSNPELGDVLPGKLKTAENGNEEQTVFCHHGKLGFPAVTGSN